MILATNNEHQIGDTFTNEISDHEGKFHMMRYTILGEATHKDWLIGLIAMGRDKKDLLKFKPTQYYYRISVD